MKLFISKLDIYLFTALGILCILSVGIIYGFKLNGPPIRSDGIGYYSYLPAVFIHGTLDFEPVVEDRFEDATAKDLKEHMPIITSSNGEEIPSFWAGLRYHEETGVYVNQYSPGVAVMQFPFFALSYGLSAATGVDMDGGFGHFFQLLIGFAGIFYFILGVIILRRYLLTKFSPQVVSTTLIAIIFGTNLFHYGTYDSSFSHAFSFFLVTLFLWLTEKWFAEIKEVQSKVLMPYSILIGIVSGLLFIVRPVNGIIALLFILYGITSLTDIKTRVYEFWKIKKSLIVLGAVGLMFVLFINMYYLYGFDHLFAMPYRDNEGFNLLQPQVANFLFSAQKGLFFWSPVLIFSVLGWVTMKRDNKWKWALLIFFLLSVWVTSSWWHWPYGGSFGSRPFVDYMALFAIPLGYFYTWAWKSKYKMVIIGITAVLILITIKTMLQYWLGVIEPGGTTLEYYFDTFLVFENRT